MNLLEKLKVIRKHQSSAPVDPLEIAKAFDLEVRFEALKDRQSGYIRRIGSYYLIGVDTTLPRISQRFTLAHEIGHWWFHKDHIDGRADRMLVDVEISGGTLSGAGVPESVERVANGFAEELLIPRNLISQLVHWDGIDNVEGIARELEVPQEALRFRLKDLGYFDLVEKHAVTADAS